MKRYLDCNEHIDHLERSVRKHKSDKAKLKAQLDTANKHIGWLKDDKVRLTKSIKVRDNAFDALIDMHEKEKKQLQADLDAHRKRISELTTECLTVEDDVSNAYKEINRLKAELATYRWIPVEERLPEKKGWYLGHFKKSTMKDVVSIVKEVFYDGQIFKADCEKYPQFTHWKPIILPKGD